MSLSPRIYIFSGAFHLNLTLKKKKIRKEKGLRKFEHLKKLSRENEHLETL